jgi:molybdenum cofactor cytidylyltransferase
MMTVCVLLAAGSSSRMKFPDRYRKSDWENREEQPQPGLTSGTDQATFPKMLLDFKGKTLLQHIIDEVGQLQDPSLLVVTGCYHSLLEKILTPQQIPFVKNEQWEAGMGNSIQKGITYLQEQYNNADNVIILVCDQPHISSALLHEMIQVHQTTGKGIVACSYNGTTGTPVLFDKKYFPQLMTLYGPNGAKKMIQQLMDNVAIINFPFGAVDIDTPEDYSKLSGTSF